MLNVISAVRRLKHSTQCETFNSLSCLFDFAVSCLAVKRGGCEQMCSNSVVPCTTYQGTYDIVYGLRPAPPTHV